MQLLAISGSLRPGASNTALLEAASRVAPAGVTIRLYDGIGGLPHFNPDLDRPDEAGLPAPVAELRKLVGEADALLVSTPEYAHGLPGSFKNALDWLVGSMEFPGKLVAILSPSARSVHAQEQLTLVLSTMSAQLMEPAVVVVQLPSRDMSAADIAANAELAAALRSLLYRVADALG